MHSRLFIQQTKNTYGNHSISTTFYNQDFHPLLIVTINKYSSNSLKIIQNTNKLIFSSILISNAVRNVYYRGSYITLGE
jgi:hypothetical protein